MSRWSQAAVEPLVRHVDREVEGAAIRNAGVVDEPVQIARSARYEAGEVAGHDLGAALVGQPGLAIGLHGHHRRIAGELRGLGRAQRQVLGMKPLDRDRARHRRTRARRLVAGVRALGARHGLHRVAPGVDLGTLELVRDGERRDGAHGRIAPGQRRQGVDLVPVRVHHVGVLGLVGHEARARSAHAIKPGVLDRPDELHEGQRLIQLRTLLGRQGEPLRRRIHVAGCRAHRAHVVAAVGAGAPQAPFVAARRLGDGEGAVTRNHPGIAARQRGLALRRVRHHQEVREPLRRRRGLLRLGIGQRAAHQGGHNHGNSSQRSESRSDDASPFTRGACWRVVRSTGCGGTCRTTGVVHPSRFLRRISSVA